MELILEDVDDHVGGTFRPRGDEGLGDSQSRAPISEADLNHDPGVLGQQQVSQHISVTVRDRHALEVTFGPDVHGAVSYQLTAHSPDGL